MLERIIDENKNKKEFYLRLKARPNSAVTKIVSVMEDDTIKIDVAAPPSKGQANREIIQFLAQSFKVGRKHVTIISGAGDRLKLIKIINSN